MLQVPPEFAGFTAPCPHCEASTTAPLASTETSSKAASSAEQEWSKPKFPKVPMLETTRVTVKKLPGRDAKKIAEAANTPSLEPTLPPTAPPSPGSSSPSLNPAANTTLPTGKSTNPGVLALLGVLGLFAVAYALGAIGVLPVPKGLQSLPLLGSKAPAPVIKPVVDNKTAPKPDEKINSGVDNSEDNPQNTSLQERASWKEAADTLPKFFAADSLQARSALLTPSARSAAQLSALKLGEKMAPPLETTQLAKIGPDEKQVTHYLFSALWNKSTPAVAIMVTKGSDGLYKVNTDAFIDLKLGALSHFLQTPRVGPAKFHCLAAPFPVQAPEGSDSPIAGMNILRLYQHTEAAPIGVIYIDPKSAAGSSFLIGTEFGQKSICTLTLKWEGTETNTPYVVVTDTNALIW